MTDSSLTQRQITSRRAHIDAIRNYRNARPGERTKTRQRLNDAATEVLAADVEAERVEKAA